MRVLDVDQGRTRELVAEDFVYALKRHATSKLRALDETHDSIAVAPIPETGLGEALNDRLRRGAAHSRENEL